MTAPRHHASRGKRSISATERWLLISRNVYRRAQRRGFVGGNPVDDLAAAIREVDESHPTDIRGILALTDAGKLTEQLRNLFAGYGLGRADLDRLLARNREALVRLAAANRRRARGALQGDGLKASLLRGAAEDAMGALRSMARAARQLEQRERIPGHPAQALTALLSRLSALADTAGEFLQEDEGDGANGLLDAVVKSCRGMAPSELAGAPVEALKGITPATGEKLRTAFGIASIRDMADSPLLCRAEELVPPVREEPSSPGGGKSAGKRGSFGDAAGRPLEGLEGVTPRQAQILGDTLKIRTVGDLVRNRFFRRARAIVALADESSRYRPQSR